MTVLTEDQAKDLWNGDGYDLLDHDSADMRPSADAGRVPAEAPAPRHHYKPLSDAADDLIAQARTLRTGERIYTGIDVFDNAMRGLAPKEMMVVNGFAHEGKTLFVTEMLRNNTDRRIIMFSADENCQLILSKLTSLVSGVSAEALEEGLSDSDNTYFVDLLIDVATQSFPNLVVYDDISDLRTMTDALKETEAVWGARCELVVFDYLDLLSGLGDGDTASKFNAIKSWGKRHNVPLVLMHQSSRSKGADGAEVTLTSGAYGGEQQATFVIGVRRKRTQYASRIRELRTKLATTQRPSQQLLDHLSEAEYDLQAHRDTVTFSLLKSKRPPCVLVGDTDFALEQATGRISPLNQAFSKSSPVHGRRPVSAAELVQWASQELPF